MHNRNVILLLHYFVYEWAKSCFPNVFFWIRWYQIIEFFTSSFVTVFDVFVETFKNINVLIFLELGVFFLDQEYTNRMRDERI